MNIPSRKLYDSLKSRLREASAAYYNGTDLTMDDVTYDKFLRQVEAAEIEHPEWIEGDSIVAVASGADVAGDVKHSAPLLSLDNAMSADELKSWFERTRAAAYSAGLEDSYFLVEPKLDGLAIVAHYKNGRLVQVVTRGDGVSGEDVTYRGQSAKGLPTTLAKKIDVEVRGEVYMTDADFEAANAQRASLGKTAFVNPRNAAAGALRNRSDDESYPLSFACYDAVGLSGDHGYVMGQLGDLGVVLAEDVTGMPSIAYLDYESIQGAIDELGRRRPTLGFGIDGAVVKANNPIVREALGNSSRAPKWAIAFKYPAEERFTILFEVIAQVGRTGVITPRARVAPVEVGGVTVEYATMHNWDLAAERDWRIGDTVSIRRAGDVVPELVAPIVSKRTGAETPVVAPIACPRCGGALDKSEKRWRCTRGRACGLAESIRYAASRDALDIEGLGEKVINQLVEKELVSDIADLFGLSPESLKTADRMGDVSVANIIGQINKARSASRARLFTALGVRGTGRSLCRRLAKHFDSLEAFATATISQLEAVDGIGSEKSVLIRSELDDLAEVIAKLLDFGITGIDAPIATDESVPANAAVSSDALAGKSVVVTGSMVGAFADKSRNDMNELIEANGGKASSSVSAKTGLLVVGEKAGSKLEKARELGIAVMTEAEFAALLGL